MFTTEKAPGELHERPHREICEEGRLLLKAADLIEADGWWDGSLESAHGHCAWTAIAQAGGSVAGGWEAGMRFASAIGVDGIDKIYAWNDARTKDEVVAKLRAVALGG